MRAALLKAPGIVEVREVETPAPSPGELLVQVRAALTCGTDLKAFVRGHALIPMPGPFGHEFSGVVAATGDGESRFAVGDPVMAVHSAPCLRCLFCSRGLFNLCDQLMTTKVLGAFAEYVLIPRHVVEQNVFRKPADIDFEEAAFLEPLSCVVHGMDGLSVGPDSTILIIGAGPIGLLHLLLARSLGARVLVSDLTGERLKAAQALGADAVLPATAVGAGVRDLTGGTGVDAVFECTGQPAVWESSVAYVRRGGTVVLFGGCRQGAKVTFSADRLHYDEITLRGVFHFRPSDVRKAFSLLAGRELGVRRLVTGRFTLEKIQDIFQQLADGSGIKFALTF